MQAQDKTEMKGLQLLTEILERAVEAGADSIDLEYVSEGLEVCYNFGNMGLGDIIVEKDIVSELIGYIVEKAKLSRGARRRMKMDIRGKPYTIIAEEYDHFGDSAFKLILKKSK